MSMLSLFESPQPITPEARRVCEEVYLRHARGDRADIAAIEARMGQSLNNARPAIDVVSGVAIIPIQGVIVPKLNLMTQISGGTSAELFRADVMRASVDPAIKAIILRIDSPGGAVNGIAEATKAVREAGAKKPVVTWSDGTMASAAYWIGSAANKVYISGPACQVGSIGIVANHIDRSGADAAAGLVRTEITAGKYKRIASDTAPLSKDGKAHMQEQVDYLYSLFVDAVATNRGTTAQGVLKRMADGRTFIGMQAIDAGLVDGVTSLEALVGDLSGGDTTKFQRRPVTGANHQDLHHGEHAGSPKPSIYARAYGALNTTSPPPTSRGLPKKGELKPSPYALSSKPGIKA